ncbi:MAG TPA: glycoside hydrolase family 32 protein [Bryobacteraceae bacterium]|nr:glycoside hydrolase family 32 protein [Bryobacteraceae bacterium]
MRRRSFLALPAVAAVAEQQRRSLAGDPQRPRYHLLPRANWMNDPNAPIYWRGRYHMFYQHNPHGAYWAGMHWGHAVSPDMVHWRHMPIALAPVKGGPDKNGVWSGCAVVNGGTPTVLYTATMPETQCLATSHTSDLSVWRRHEQNPVLAKRPDGLELTGFRDPCVWQEDGTWYMALGSGFKAVGGAVLLYRSPDLVDWTYMHPLFEGRLDPNATASNPAVRGEMWECPSFFALGDKHVLFVSTQGGTPYWIGTYKDFRFTPEYDGHLDTGSYYAAITQLDAQGRRILWGWIRERRSGRAQRAAGWSGVLSLPRVLVLRRDGRLGMAPAQQVRSLRGRRREFANLFAPDGGAMEIPDLRGDAIELLADWDALDADEFGIAVLDTPIRYNRASRHLAVGKERPAAVPLESNQRLRLNVFMDCSLIEVFANGRACVTARAYIPNPAESRVSIWARGGSAKLRSLIVYEMKPISADRLTT